MGERIGMLNGDEALQEDVRVAASTLESMTDDEVLVVVANLMRFGSTVDTLPILHALLGRSPQNGHAHYLLAVEQAALGLMPEARNSFSRAVHFSPELVDARLQYVMLLLATGEFTEAQTQWSQVAAAQPTGSAGEVCLALGCVLRGDLTSAQSVIDQLAANAELQGPLVRCAKGFFDAIVDSGRAEVDSSDTYIGGYAKLHVNH
jgi:Flp pilus assembly protein TadD